MNGKQVDTQIMGIFRKAFKDDQIEYWPHPDYLEAGKFKLQKNLKVY